MSHIHILTVVVVILGVLLCVTILSIVAYFILRTKRKMQRERTKAAPRRLSRGSSEHEISNGDTIEMLPWQNNNITESVSPCASATNQNETEVAVNSSQPILVVSQSQMDENKSRLSSSVRNQTNTKKSPFTTRKRLSGVSEEI